MTTILGINSAYHESSACIIVDGQIVAAAEEERFNRFKHAKPARVDNPHELPLKAMEYCLQEAGLSLKQVDHIGFSFEPIRRLKNKDFPDPVTAGDWGSPAGEGLFFQKLQEVPGKLSQLAGANLAAKFRWLEHHACHAASAYFVSPYDQAAILIVDGIGEVESTTLYKGQANKIAIIDSLTYPNSLGFFWEKISKFLGFSEYDACKVMGLASYGDPEPCYEALSRFITITDEGFTVDNERVKFRVEAYAEFEEQFGQKRQAGEELEQRHADLAAALQKITEDILLHLAERLHRQTGSQNLCLAGGVALNCVANRILLEAGPFEQLYVQPAAHDAGTAIGAAAYIWHQLLDEPRSYVMSHPYVGPGYNDAEIKAILDDRADLAYVRHDNIEQITARLVAGGQVVAWFQGRMELGPRALGNRTLLADPRNPNMRDILNMKVKHREYFRPFAPSVLAEKAGDWFRISKESLSSDFMLFAYDVLESKRMLIPAVVHVDGTSRIQTVRPEGNPKYYRLIKEFEQLTGVPLVLNTSFNDSEPIVCSPQDAINTFLKTSIDYLVMGDFLVSKEGDRGLIVELPHQRRSRLIV